MQEKVHGTAVDPLRLLMLFVTILQDTSVIVYIPLSAGVADLRYELRNKHGIPLDRTWLRFGCTRVLHDDRTLRECGIGWGSCVHVDLRAPLRGGVEADDDVDAGAPPAAAGVVMPAMRIDEFAGHDRRSAAAEIARGWPALLGSDPAHVLAMGLVTALLPQREQAVVAPSPLWLHCEELADRMAPPPQGPLASPFGHVSGHT